MTDLDLDAPSLTTHVEGQLGWITINSPKRLNSLNEDMWQAFPQIIQKLDQDKDIRAILIRGEGEKAFSAGADISEFDRVREGDAAENYNKLNTAAFKALQDCQTPTIAMIHGFCMGGGLLLALSADLRLASEDAQFSLPPAKLGLGFDVRWLSPLLQIVPPHIAKELLFTADRFTAEQCMLKGLLNSVHSPRDLETATKTLAKTIGSNAPLTLKNVKSAINALAANDHHIDFETQDALAQVCYNSKDYEEGRLAFAERRAPHFKGE
ncbi:enoyl-CoA hydratase [Hyphomicrobiales bacterium 4NK60-0047b]